MANLNGFDANKVDPSVGFEPIPEGKYLATITDSEMIQNKAGTGHYLKLRLEIMEGQYRNRVLFHNLNLDHPNEKAVEIAQSELSAICRAVGVMTPRDSVELHNLPLTIKVKVRKREDNGELSNDVKGFSKKDDVLADTATASTAGPDTTPPWQK